MFRQESPIPVAPGPRSGDSHGCMSPFAFPFDRKEVFDCLTWRHMCWNSLHLELFCCIEADILNSLTLPHFSLFTVFWPTLDWCSHRSGLFTLTCFFMAPWRGKILSMQFYISSCIFEYVVVSIQCRWVSRHTCMHVTNNPIYTEHM